MTVAEALSQIAQVITDFSLPTLKKAAQAAGISVSPT